jgi:N utilization substance protein A
VIDIDILKNIEKEEGISKDYLIEVINAALKTAYKKTFEETNSVVKVNLVKGEVRLYAEKRVVEHVNSPLTEISLKEAQKFESDTKVGDQILIEIPLKNLSASAITSAKQVFQQKIMEKKRDITYDIFSNKVGETVTGRITRMKGKGNIGVNIEPYNIEGFIPPEEQIPTERLFRDKLIKAYIKETVMTDGGPLIVLSRASPEFLSKLLEMEVPEITQKIVEVRAISREPGIRAKISVASKDINVDPVGACIGQRGVRINNVSKEINYERIDVIRFNANPEIYIENSMSPAKVERVEMLPDGKGANVYTKKSEYATAMGANGVNVSLASKLTGYFIHLVEPSEEGD